MLGQCGTLYFTCSPQEKDALATHIIKSFAKMYAGSCGINYSKRQKKIDSIAKKELCEITPAGDGLLVKLMDIQEACFTLADSILEESNYYNEFESSNELSFKYAINSIFSQYPHIKIVGSITISYPYSESRAEAYKTIDGKLICTEL